MFHYFPRKFVLERLRMSHSASYRFFGAARRLRSDYILDLLNRTRHGPQSVLVSIPHDLRTPAEMAALLSESNITEKMLKAWTHRQKNPPPFFRLNSHHLLFRNQPCSIGWMRNLVRVATSLANSGMIERARQEPSAADFPEH